MSKKVICCVIHGFSYESMNMFTCYIETYYILSMKLLNSVHLTCFLLFLGFEFYERPCAQSHECGTQFNKFYNCMNTSENMFSSWVCNMFSKLLQESTCEKLYAHTHNTAHP